ncbi:MAG: aquaporin [Candidatus Nanosyncoccus sp.]|mgnify:CR=1 FL=1
MATSKSKKAKKSTEKPKNTNTKPEVTVIEEIVTVTEPETIVTEKAEVKEFKKNKNIFANFFAKKGDPEENILTIFKSPRIWGALAGELIGTMFITILLLTLGIYQPLYVFFGVIGVTLAVFSLSGAHLNPALTAGMMATRRVSAIRGILYMVAQVVGAWLGLIIVNAFRMAGETKVDLPALTAVETSNLWKLFAVEFLGVFTLAFFFNRAQEYKSRRNAFTYAAIIGGGMVLAVLFAIVISSNFFKISNNFILNPAVAIMYQIFPTSAENFGTLISKVGLEILVFILAPIVASVLAFFIGDIATTLADEDECENHHHGKDCPCHEK